TKRCEGFVMSQENAEKHGWPSTHPEAGRDIKIGHLLFKVLFGLCLLGIVLLLAVTRAATGREGDFLGPAIFGICLLFIVLALLLPKAGPGARDDRRLCPLRHRLL